jgi:hypothetical protein
LPRLREGAFCTILMGKGREESEFETVRGQGDNLSSPQDETFFATKPYLNSFHQSRARHP